MDAQALDERSIESVGCLDAATFDAARDARLGTVIGEQYCLSSSLGKGRLSAVYKASAVNQPDSPVAIKIINGDSLSHHVDTIRLFESNARLTVRHPNLITMYGCGLTAEGEPWQALEYLHGNSLENLLRSEGYLSLNAALPVFYQILDALAYVHQQGELHVNLKPTNILLVETADGKPFVKIADFGIAKMLLQRELELLGKDEPVCGSPWFMSPEQFQGEPVDSRSDVYSLGCIFYNMLTGRPPHQGVTLLETMDLHLNAEVEFPGEPEISLPLQAVLRKMLARYPVARQRTAADVKADLIAALKGEPPVVIPMGAASGGCNTAASAGFNPAASGGCNTATSAGFNPAVGGWKKPRGKKGNEPWPLLLACITLLLLIAVVQQSLTIARALNERHAAMQQLGD